MNERVLVVDDSALARRTARHILERAGYMVTEAEDGMAALEKYALERPDLVLLDLVMKGMYGLDVLTKLRQLDPGARVVVVSADIQRPSRDAAAAAGAIAFVNKPIDETELRAVATAALKVPQ
jgi:two-component system, chemotaxis family, chemotaxis protein CheY